MSLWQNKISLLSEWQFNIKTRLMDTKIFEIITNTGGLALVLSILFFYSLNSFRQHTRERIELRRELSRLQADYHVFKNEMIERMFDSQEKLTEVLTQFKIVLEKNLRR